MSDFFSAKNTVYVVKHKHQFVDTLYIPASSEIRFEGGSLSGPIKFDKTKLTGNVNIKGSHICGKVKNVIFDASWLCAMDGESDDAEAINQMIEVGSVIFFPRGEYRLRSRYEPRDLHEECYRKAIHSHIGINKSHVTLRGEDGATFISDDPLGTISIYSQPNDIDNNIGDISIENLYFKTLNDGVSFHEFMLVIETFGVNGLLIKDCYFDDFWGDAICLSHYGDTPETGERTRNQNIKIQNNIIIGGAHHNNRNGISVINGNNVLIKGNTIRNTSRNDMPGGIDIEPNNSAYTINNIHIENNLIEGCYGEVGAIGIVMLNDNAPGHHITIKSNIIRKCSNGIAIALKTKDSTSDFFITDNYIDEETPPYKFVFSGTSKNWTIKNNRFERPCLLRIPGDIKVDNLVMKNNKKKD